MGEGRRCPVAKPDLDDGWLKYAHELDAALAAADFTKGERIVLREVFAQIYGPALRPAARLSSTEIAKRCGKIKQFIDEAIQRLVANQVLERRGKGWFRFRKDYESWLYKGGTPKAMPRFDKAEVAWIASAPTMAMAYKNIPMEDYPGSRSTNGVTHKQPPVNQRGDNLSPNGVTKVNQRGDNLSPNGVTISESPPDPPYKDFKTETETGDDDGARPASKAVTALSVSGPPSTPDALRSWARSAVSPLEHLADKLDGWIAAGYPIAWIHAAVQSALSSARAGGVAQYANKCLLKWQAAGKAPHEAPPPKADPSLLPISIAPATPDPARPPLRSSLSGLRDRSPERNGAL
jgi:hypothetical protein